MTVVDLSLVLAVLVVVPVAAGLVPGAHRAVPLALLGAGGPTTVALLLTPTDGPLPGALTLPWVLVTAGVAVTVLRSWLADGPSLLAAPWVAACGYLAFGALWLLADRTGFEPAGFGPPFVQLTAVHFTYAGFVATVLAALVLRRRPTDRVAATAAVATVGAPPVVAIGFAAVGWLQIVGAVVLTIGTYATAWVTLRHVVPTIPRAAAWALGLSSVSVLVPMVLAVQWAVGANLGTPALSIPRMAATHGVANAVGFALLGVLGWELVRRGGAASDGSRAG